MSRKASKIISQRTPKKKEPLGFGAKFGIALGVAVIGALGFLFAERLGFTGTHFLLKDEIVIEQEAPRRARAENADGGARRKKKRNPAAQKKSSKKEDAAASRAESEDSPDASAKDASAARSRGKKSAAAKSAPKAPPVEPLPAAAFAEISRRPQTWPIFVRLTRGRSISLVDPQTGISMGRMDVPAGTVVKVRKVGASGTLDVYDRTGQIFQVEASGTNFSAAYAAAKNKPKKKPAKKQPKPAAVAKTLAQQPGNTAESVPAAAPQQPPKKAKYVSAFGVVSDDDWDGADDE